MSDQFSFDTVSAEFRFGIVSFNWKLMIPVLAKSILKACKSNAIMVDISFGHFATFQVNFQFDLVGED